MADFNDNRTAPTNGAEPAEANGAAAEQPEGAAPQETSAETPGDAYGAAPAGAADSKEVSHPPVPSFVSRMATAVAAGVIAVLAWFIPGAGHLVLRRWQRALAFFIAVGGLAVSGYLMRGNVFRVHSPDPFGTLGFIADACSGAFYLLSRTFESAGPNVSRAIGDYGTRFIAAAGIVNVLGICDAFEIARGRRR